MKLSKIALTLCLLLIVGCQQSKNELTLKDDEVGIIGYGSLTSVKSMEETLGRKYDGFFEVVELKDYKRNWKVFMPNRNDLYEPYFFVRNNDTVYPQNILYLNMDSSQDSRLNGCLFVVKKSELADFDKREWIYKRVDVTKNIEGLKINNGNVYAYTALDEFKVPANADSGLFALRRTYLDIVDSAFRYLNPEYKTRFFETTEPYDEKLVIDDKTLDEQ